MPHPVLVVGDANVDLVLTGDVVPRFGQVEQMLEAADLVLGGSAAIVACGLARLGVPTTLVATVGDDVYGEVVRSRLQECGVRTGAVRTVRGAATGISVVLSQPGDRAILTHQGAMTCLEPDEVRAAARDTAWVHLASPFLLPDLSAALPGVLRSLPAEVGTSLDPNWDPTGSWTAVATLIGMIDVLLPNQAEASALAAVLRPGRADPARALAEIGPRVVVKKGAEGAVSVTAETIVQVPSDPVEVVDTTGAGDSFDAGYLAALAHAVPDEAQRLRWACAAGARSTRALGGTAAQARLDEIR